MQGEKMEIKIHMLNGKILVGKVKKSGCEELLKLIGLRRTIALNFNVKKTTGFIINTTYIEYVEIYNKKYKLA